MAIVLFHNKNGAVVTDKRIIKSVLKKANKKFGTSHYVDEKFKYIKSENSGESDFKDFADGFHLYSLVYFSGCFYPYLTVKPNPNCEPMKTNY